MLALAGQDDQSEPDLCLAHDIDGFAANNTPIHILAQGLVLGLLSFPGILDIWVDFRFSKCAFIESRQLDS